MDDINILPQEGEALHLKCFFSQGSYFEELRDTIQWHQGEVKIFGRVHPEPRLTAWYGEKESIYTYSGKKMLPLPWTKALVEILNALKGFGNFNACLLNYYRDGADAMGFHADNEKELGVNPVIASVSFGGSRDFVFKHRRTGEKVKLLLEDGDVVVMKGETQNYWVHGIPKRKRANPRINLTFRRIVRC